MKLSNVFAVVVVLVWAGVVAHILYHMATLITGKLHRRPTVSETIFSNEFILIWGIPTLIFLAIYGGIFWW